MSVLKISIFLTMSGEDVLFDSIMKKNKMSDPALTLLAEIVRAADSHPKTPHPAGEELRWIAHGFSDLGLSDHEILDRELIVYDVILYPSTAPGAGLQYPISIAVTGRLTCADLPC